MADGAAVGAGPILPCVDVGPTHTPVPFGYRRAPEALPVEAIGPQPDALGVAVGPPVKNAEPLGPLKRAEGMVEFQAIRDGAVFAGLLTPADVITSVDTKLELVCDAQLWL